MRECLGEETALELVLGQLGQDARERVEIHIDGCSECRQLLADTARATSREDFTHAHQPGQLVAERFQLEVEAGVGGAGVVYRATDQVTGAPVAIKLLRESTRSHEERFMREASLLAELEHPGIVQYLAHGKTESGQSYLAMSWLDGQTLADRLVAGPLTFGDVRKLMSRLTDALSAAHRRGIVHRDLKPRNVFLPDDELARATLLDFGIARRVKGNRALTAVGAAVGTPGYMAPEQARGDAEVDTRADVFSLGCILYKCLTGQSAFRGSDPMAVLAKILLDEPPPVESLRRDTPAELAQLIREMMAKAPDQRPSDASVLANRLRALEADTREDVTPDLASPAPSRRGRTSSTSTSGLTSSERRVLCILFLRNADGDDIPTSVVQPIAKAYGGRLEALADGSAVVVLTSAGGSSDQAVRAARLALALHATLPSAATVLATGLAVVAGSVPIGDVVDRGAALLAIAAPGELRLDETTAPLLEARFYVGADESGALLHGERDVAEPPRRLLGKVPPFVGRRRELGTLHATLEECIQDSVARAVVISAPAGGGKSRLLGRWLAELREQGTKVEVLFGRGDPISTTEVGLSTLADAVRRSAGILPDDRADVRRAKLEARVARNVAAPDQARVFAALRQLTGAAFDTSEHTRAQDPRALADATRVGFEDLVAAECAAAALVIVIEDAQWSDVATLRLLNSTLRNLSNQPLMIVALGRPEVHARIGDLWAQRAVLVERMAPLSTRASTELVRASLPEGTSMQVVARIVARGDGNPFLTEELVRAHAAGRTHDLPDTVVGVLQTRLDVLGEEPRRILRAASIVGPQFGLDALDALVPGFDGQARAELDRFLEELVRREVLVRLPQSSSASDQWGFHHELLRDAVYGMLTPDDRRLGHHLAAAWLTSQHGEPVAIARHHELAGERREAAEWFLAAAERGLRSDEPTIVSACVNAAARCEPSRELEVSLLLVHAEALTGQSNLEAARLCSDALQLAEEGTSAWFRAMGIAAMAHAGAGQMGEVTRLAERIRDAWPKRPHDGGAPLAVMRIVHNLLLSGDIAFADELLSLVDEDAELLEASFPLHVRRLWLRAARVMEDDPLAYLHTMTQALAHFDQVGDLRSATNARIGMGWAHLLLGDNGQAEPLLRQAMHHARRMELPHTQMAAAQNLGLVVARSGDLEEGRRLTQDSASVFAETNDHRMEGCSHLYAAQIECAGEQWELAETEAQRAVELLSETPPLRAQAMAVLSDALRKRGQLEEALALARDAAALEEKSETSATMVVQVALAEALYSQGEHDEARRVLRDALEQLDARAQALPDREARERLTAGIWENARAKSLAESWGRSNDF